MTPALSWAQGLIEPLEYPFGVVAAPKPLFIWQDLYLERDGESKVSYRLTLQDESAAENRIKVYNFMPRRYLTNFYLYRFPDSLKNGKYSYSIERIMGGASMDSRYYHYYRYPIARGFEVNTGRKSEIENLSDEALVQYLYLDRKNTLNNGYNALFFSTSSTVTLGIGILFYKVINLGVWSTVISAICFGSSAVGYTAAGYYTWRYYGERKRLQRIVDLDKNTSIKGGVTGSGITTEAEFRF